MLAVQLSHTFHDGEVGFTGLATGKAAATYITNIPLAAMRLAQLTHAPNLTILFSGWCVNPDLTALKQMPESEYDNALLNLPCEAHMTSWPGPWSHHRGEIDFAFCSGAQVDAEGNVNSIRIGKAVCPKVALVGPIFVPEHMAEFGREYIMIPHHEKRTLVLHVDSISGVGYPGGRANRRELGLRGDGPCCIYTPKCIFSFDEAGKIRVESIHPGVEPEELAESTGFELGNLTDVPVTPEPGEEELTLLRTQVDPNGMLLDRDE
jgi:glutaconate CoA-transferase subunit B